MTGPEFKEKLQEKVFLKVICEHCGKPLGQGKGLLTSWIFGDKSCQCKVSPAKGVLIAPSPSVSAPAASTSVSAPDGSHASPLLEVNLGDRYEVLEELGRGGMGTVFKVKDKVLDKVLAVKVLKPELASDKVSQKRFAQEAEATMRLTHANLVAVYSHGVTPGNAPYLVMDYLQGETLADILARQGYLEADRVLNICSQICEALAHAHAKGIVHRDLKPNNIIVTKTEQGNDLIKIVDFGIAKLMPSINQQTQNLTASGELFGSPFYMSPEQCKDEALDARSDIYSLGCVMYELLTGKTPFSSSNPLKVIIAHLNDAPRDLTEANPAIKVPAGLPYIVANCLDKDSNSRYQSAMELQADLNALSSGMVPRQRNEAPFPSRVIALLVDTLVLLPIFSLMFYLFGAPETRQTMQDVHYVLRVALTTLPISCLEVATGAISLDQFVETAIRAVVFLQTKNEWLYGKDFELVQHLRDLSYTFEVFFTIWLSNWLYHATMESSRLQSTLGKRLAGLKVQTVTGKRVTFWQASRRHFSRILSMSTLGLTYLIARRGKARIALHDKLSNCRVVRLQRASAPMPRTNKLSWIVAILSVSLFVATSLWMEGHWDPHVQNPGMPQFELAQKDLQRGNYKQALKNAQAAVANGDLFAYSMCGDAYVAMKQYEKAVAEYDKALEVSAGIPNDWWARAHALSLLGRFDQAENDAAKAKALEVKLSDTAIPFGWGSAYRAEALVGLKRYEEAIIEGTNAIREAKRTGFLEPAIEGYIQRARAESALGKYQESLNDIAAAQAVPKNRRTGGVFLPVDWRTEAYHRAIQLRAQVLGQHPSKR